MEQVSKCMGLESAVLGRNQFLGRKGNNLKIGGVLLKAASSDLKSKVDLLEYDWNEEPEKGWPQKNTM